MLRSDFIESPEWQAILTRMRELSDDATLGLRNAGDFPTTRYCAGLLTAYEIVAELPEKLFSDGDPIKETKQPDGTLDLPNHPRPTKAFY